MQWQYKKSKIIWVDNAYSKLKRTQYRNKECTQVDSNWKWVAWRLTSCETSLPSIGSWWGWFQPRLLLNQSLISPSGAPVKPLPLHHNSPQSATLDAIYCHLATQTEHCAAENGGQSRASSFRLLEKFFVFFYFYVHIYSGYLNCSFGCHPQMLERLITQLLGVML